MKTIFLKAFVFLILAGLFNACNDNVIEEATDIDPLLKSAQSNKISYIVVLNDAELNAELPQLKGYEQREKAVQHASGRILTRAGVIGGEVEHLYNTAITGFSVKMTPGQLDKLQNDPAVVRIEEDKIMTLIEPLNIKPSGDIEAQSESTPYGIVRVNGGATYSGDKVAWIIDTGIDHDHPDLNVDDTRGAYFVGRGTSSSNDDNGHGSHVAGTVAAIGGNGIGVVGVAAGATVIPVKVLDRNGSGTLSGVIDGVDFVAANASAGDVANMSLGGGVSITLDNAVKNAAANGIYFALAAGNESDDANNHSPARANGDYIYTISAMDINDNFAYFSNYGNPPVDYCEPGVSIHSTYKDGGYATASGTSMAAPHMAGILLWGLPGTDGTVNNDPDANDPDNYSDPIGVVGDGGGGGSTNTNPTAAINGPYTGSEDTGVSFDATGSSDADNDPLSYTWDFGDGTTTTTSSTVVTHTYLWGGSFTVNLTVNDGNGGTATETTTATITEVNDKPVADPGGPYSSVTGQEILFDASGSYDYDNVDGTNDNNQTLTYNWDFGDGSTLTNSNTSASHIYSSTGDYTVKLIVNDGTIDSDQATTTVTVTDVAVSVAPSVDLFDVANTSNPAWTRVSVNWSVSDADSDLEWVYLIFKDSSGNTVDSATIAVNGSSASGTNELGKKGNYPGPYTVELIVTDAAENSTPETVQVPIN